MQQEKAILKFKVKNSHKNSIAKNEAKSFFYSLFSIAKFQRFEIRDVIIISRLKGRCNLFICENHL